MSNQAFDQLCRRLELSDARNALAAYESARKQPDLTAQDIEFLDRAIPETRKRIEAAERNARSLTA